MITINPYLNFAGNTEEAFNFYKSVFGGDFLFVQRFKDSPGEAGKVSEDDADKLMHISLPVGNNILMATDALESMGHKLKPGNNFQLSIDTDSNEQADELFKKLSDGGTVFMPMADTFWGAYFGMLTDKFGIQWMVSHTPKQ